MPERDPPGDGLVDRARALAPAEHEDHAGVRRELPLAQQCRPVGAWLGRRIDGVAGHEIPSGNDVCRCHSALGESEVTLARHACEEPGREAREMRHRCAARSGSRARAPTAARRRSRIPPYRRPARGAPCSRSHPSPSSPRFPRATCASSPTGGFGTAGARRGAWKGTRCGAARRALCPATLRRNGVARRAGRERVRARSPARDRDVRPCRRR